MSEYIKIWKKNNPDKVKQHRKDYYSKHKKKLNKYEKEKWQELRLKAIEKLGGRCSSVECRWVNEDGSKGCVDTRALQVDHVNGGGTKERKQIGYRQLYRKVIKDTENTYQLLCANCNWIKKSIFEETVNFNISGE